MILIKTPHILRPAKFGLESGAGRSDIIIKTKRNTLGEEKK
ncbi:hypothetical protein AEST_07770 [Alishewanella aestuarii B11]|uniref:Uncharacterized protein n=1 Tax=Alishewanella aestuarii B11 TaxID=1197174 RepID=J1QLI5_9ALTE|nr:hypothetical protein AEST_07770 [Alishewanella aestuarii B11]